MDRVLKKQNADLATEIERLQFENQRLRAERNEARKAARRLVAMLGRGSDQFWQQAIADYPWLNREVA